MLYEPDARTARDDNDDDDNGDDGNDDDGNDEVATK